MLKGLSFKYQCLAISHILRMAGKSQPADQSRYLTTELVPRSGVIPKSHFPHRPVHRWDGEFPTQQ